MVANASQTVLRRVVVSVVDEQRAAYSSFLSFCPTLRFLQPHDDILHQHAGLRTHLDRVSFLCIVHVLHRRAR